MRLIKAVRGLKGQQTCIPKSNCKKVVSLLLDKQLALYPSLPHFQSISGMRIPKISIFLCWQQLEALVVDNF